VVEQQSKGMVNSLLRLGEDLKVALEKVAGALLRLGAFFAASAGLNEDWAVGVLSDAFDFFREDGLQSATLVIHAMN
jgi:hypothetical protein